jgi:uncharacterized membrane protein YbhN (UPF0104 family)
MKRAGWAWARLLGAAALLGVLIWRVGTGPFVDGIETVSGWSLLAALAITAVTTIGSAVRWRAVARALGVPLSLTDAITGYYRSQFLNSALPGGVLGDVYRGVRHGRDTDDLGHALRAVAWERGAGQLVQAGLATLVLLILPSPVRSSMPWVILATVGVVVGLTVVVRAQPLDGRSRRSRITAAIRGDLRALLARRVWPVITGTSAIAVVGYTSVFLIAARTSAPSAAVGRLLPLTMLVLLAMTVPLSIAGWGPREGVAAWAFAAAGLGLDHGVAAATAYGVLSFAATLPGAVVLFAGWLRRRLVAKRPVRPLSLKHAVHG